MNELGNNSYKIHDKLLKQLDDTIFKFVILCGEFFELSIKKFFNPNNELIVQILVPELVSNLEFGGKEGNILYVTATSSLYKMELNQIGAKFK